MRRLIATALLLALSTLPACGDGTGPGLGLGTQTGTYTLRTVNGNTLPFTIEDGAGVTVVIVSDAFTLQEGGRFSETFTLRVTENGTTTTESGTNAGAWTLTGTAVTLTIDGGGPAISGTLSGGVLSIVDSGFSLVYRR
jgi:hypothetical protein